MKETYKKAKIILEVFYIRKRRGVAAKVNRGLETILILCYSSTKSAQKCGKIEYVADIM
jgi:hypothetical protein